MTHSKGFLGARCKYVMQLRVGARRSRHFRCTDNNGIYRQQYFTQKRLYTVRGVLLEIVNTKAIIRCDVALRSLADAKYAICMLPARN